MSGPRVTILLRSPRHLVRWWAFAEVAPGEREGDEPDGDTEPSQGMQVLGTKLSSEDLELSEAWARLGEVAELSGRTRQDVELVLSRTIAHPHEEAESLPSLELEPPPERPRATAAHPRAYQGTKKQPPKPRRSDSLDLRPYLGSRRGVELLALRLRALELDSPARGGVPFEAPFEAWEAPPGLRLALGLHWRAGWTAGERREAEVLWRHVDGEAQPSLGPQLAFVAARGAAQDTLEFLRSIAAVLPEQRMGVAFGLLEVIGAASGAGALSEGLATSLGALSMEAAGAEAEHPVHLSSWTRLLAVAPQEERSAVVAGARFAARFGKGKAVEADRAPSEKATACLTEIAGEVEIYGPVRRWADLGVFPAGLTVMQRILEAVRSDELIERVGEKFLNDVTSAYAFSQHKAAPKEVTEHLTATLAALVAVGHDFQMQGWTIYYQATHWGARWAYLVLVRTPAAIRRWCRTPFRDSSELEQILDPLFRVNDEHWDRVLAAPDEPFQALETLFERNVDACLGSLGLEASLDFNEAWALDQLLHRPRPFGRLLRLLGMLSEERRRELLRGGFQRYASSPDAAASLEDIVRWIDGLPLPTGASPVAAKVRSHLRGEFDLTQGQIERQIALLRSAWPDLLVASLRFDVLSSMATGLIDQDRALEPESLEQLPEELMHALLFQAGLESSRRSLRRMIRALFEGDEEVLARHPRNREWMRQLAKSVSEEAAEIWASPPSVTVHVQGVGEVTLAVEHKPLEALRMGTYVGSCYSVGGYFRYAAAAVVLDSNKHVVFARLKDGTFLARQILGVSDSWWLHCSYVYPHREDRSLMEAFLDYDRELASLCGMELADENDEGKGEVQCLVSEDDWDDGLVFHSDPE